jgi:vancomycin permeability regulator SanA
MAKNKTNGKAILKTTAAAVVLVALLGAVALVVLNRIIVEKSAGYIISETEAAALGDVDCILILGAGIYANKYPSLMLSDRLAKGVGLYELGAADRLLMSGDNSKVDYNEVKVMKDYAVGAGVPSSHVFQDHAGFSTYESMYRARDVFAAAKIIVVTQTTISTARCTTRARWASRPTASRRRTSVTAGSRCATRARCSRGQRTRFTACSNRCRHFWATLSRCPAMGTSRINLFYRRTDSKAALHLGDVVFDGVQMLLDIVDLLLGFKIDGESITDSCLSRAAWRFWLIMMMGAWNAAMNDRQRFNKINGFASNWIPAIGNVFHTIHTASTDAKMMMNFQLPPKDAIASAIRSDFFVACTYCLSRFVRIRL